MPIPLLGLLVLRALDIELSLAFYKTIGLEFIQEQHGSGPLHFSSSLGGMVIEIYPGKVGTAPDRKTAGATMIGFQVGDLDSVLTMLKVNGAILITEPQDSVWGRRAVVQDPDGRAVELSQIQNS